MISARDSEAIIETINKIITRVFAGTLILIHSTVWRSFSHCFRYNSQYMVLSGTL